MAGSIKGKRVVQVLEEVIAERGYPKVLRSDHGPEFVSTWFHSREHAKVIIETWRKHYNLIRPHSSLDYQTPSEFVAGWQKELITGARVSR